MVVVPCRAHSLLSFGGQLSQEWRDRRAGVKVTSPALRKRRCQPAWLLDRTTLYGALRIIHAYWQEPERMLFLLAALTNGFTTWGNLEAAGGVSFLNQAFESFDPGYLLAMWRSAHFAKKAYDTEESLRLLVLSGEWLDGFVRFLHRWKAYIGGEVLLELYAHPGPSPRRTYDILRVTGGLSKMALLAMHRMLGLYDKRLFDGCQCWDVGFMAQPILEFVHGRYSSMKMMCNSCLDPAKEPSRTCSGPSLQDRPRMDFDHVNALRDLADYVTANPRFLNYAACLPGYAKEGLQTLLQVWCSEWWKALFKPLRVSLEDYTANNDFSYNVLFDDFESKFIVGEMLVSMWQRATLATTGSLAASLVIRGSDAGEASFRNLKRARAVEGRRIRRVFEFDGRVFQSLNKFCEYASPMLTNARSLARRKLYRTCFPREDTLWVDCEAHQLADVWVADDCKGNPKFELDVNLRDRRCPKYTRGTLLYAVDVMEEISGSTANWLLLCRF